MSQSNKTLWQAVKFTLFLRLGGHHPDWQLHPVQRSLPLELLGGLPALPGAQRAVELYLQPPLYLPQRRQHSPGHGAGGPVLPGVYAPCPPGAGDALNAAGWNEYLVLALTMGLNFVTEFLYQRLVVYPPAHRYQRRGPPGPGQASGRQNKRFLMKLSSPSPGTAPSGVVPLCHGKGA